MWICRICGTLSDDPEKVCCDEKVVPLETAFDFQERLFDLESNDRARSVFASLRAQYSEAAGAVTKAERKVRELSAHRDRCGEILTDFYKLTCDSADEDDEDDEPEEIEEF